MNNNPPIRLTKEQWHALNRAVAVAEVTVDEFKLEHHRQAVIDAREVLANARVPELGTDFSLTDCLETAGLPVPARLQ